MIRHITILTLFLCSFFTVCGQDSKETYWDNLPKPTGWVNDFENIFTVEQVNILDSLIAEYENRTTIEISIITIPTSATDKKRFDELTVLLADKWGVGKKEKDNGILIGISKGLRTIRINNGFGIEKLVTDTETKDIIDNYFIPYFKSGQYYEGTFNGLTEMINLLKTKLE